MRLNWLRGPSPSILALASVLITSSAAAQDRENLPTIEMLEEQCAPEVQVARRATMNNGTQAGIWFHADVARCMLGRLELLPHFAWYAHLLEGRLALTTDRDLLRDREVALATAEADAAGVVLETAVRARREAEESRDAWYRSPVFWLTVGTVVTILLEVAAVAVLTSVKP